MYLHISNCTFLYIETKLTKLKKNVEQLQKISTFMKSEDILSILYVLDVRKLETGDASGISSIYIMFITQCSF